MNLNIILETGKIVMRKLGGLKLFSHWYFVYSFSLGPKENKRKVKTKEEPKSLLLPTKTNPRDRFSLVM